MKLFGLAIAAVFLGIGCASSRVSDSGIDAAFREQNYDLAVEKLKKGLEKEGEDGRDALLYLMDLGLSLHSAGKYDESSKYFASADKLAEIKDYTSLSTEFSTFLISDQIRTYKGEDFEKVLINAFSAINYACIGNVEDALVESRLVNRKLRLMVEKGERKYKQNAFALYLAAMLYESERNWNDAYIDYKAVRELMPDWKGLGQDLWRMAWINGDREEMDRWKKQYDLSQEQIDQAKAIGPKSKMGEVIVIFENGIGPEKVPNPAWNQLPHFVSRHNTAGAARVSVDGKQVTTVMLHDIESTAIQNLEDNYALMVAKKSVGLVGKIIIGEQVRQRTNSDFLGTMTQILLLAADQPDLRSWRLLPKDLQVARIPVDAGVKTIEVTPLGIGSSEPIESSKRVIQLEVKPGTKVFTSVRYMP